MLRDEIKKAFGNATDLIVRPFIIDNREITLVMSEVLGSSSYVNDFILRRLLTIKFQSDDIGSELLNFIPTNNGKILNKLSDMTDYICMGFALILFSDTEAIAIEARATVDRGIPLVSNESSITGSKDAFNENFNTNIGLIRRRIRDANLYVDGMFIGKSSKTKIGILYMNNIVIKDNVKKIKNKLNKINVDGIIDVGVTKVPLVCQSCIFDLRVGDYKVRPDINMAYEACINAQNNNPKMGNYGAGTGASVGKILGADYAMKSGLGFYAVQVDDVKVGAIVSVNAFGDIYDYDSGKMIAGLLNKNKDGFRSSEKELIKITQNNNLSFTSKNNIVTNTTIGAVITNAKFTKSQMGKIASMAHNGFARAIKPVHTTVDGDSIYAMSVGDINASLDSVGTLAAIVMGRAINNAVKSADTSYGFKSYRDIIKN